MKNIPIELQFNTAQQDNAYIPVYALYSYVGLNLGNYSRWINKNLLSLPTFTEGVDYTTHPLDDDYSSNKRTGCYHVTLNTAKHLVAMSRTKIGHEYRQYLIDSEVSYRKSLEKQLKLATKASHYTIRNYIDEHTCLKQMPSTQPIAFKVHSYCQKHGLEVKTQPSQRYGTINLYPVEVLETYFELIT